MSYATVRNLGDTACIDAVRALTLKVCASAESGDAVAARIAQKQLGTALLRWVLLREDELQTAANAAADTGSEPSPSEESVDAVELI